MTDAVHILWTGDCRQVMSSIDSETLDSVVTDPPYGLSKEPDIAEVLTHWLAGDDYTHTQTGFMGKKWDSFVPGPVVWREALRVLKPGGHMLVFAGSRTVDLMGMSIRLAGFEIRDCLSWMYGCLTDDTEVLTGSGWRLGTEVEVGDVVAQWDPTTEAITLASVERKYLAPWTGPMRVLRNADTDQVLTPNHRVWHRTASRQMVTGNRRQWYEDGWVVAEADEVTCNQPTRLPLSGLHDGVGIGSEDYASLLGWVWTEGGFDKAPSTGVRIYQSPSANPGKVKEIDLLIERLGIPAKRYERERIYRYKDAVRPYTEVCWFFTGEWAARARVDLPEKHPTYDLLWRMTQAEKVALYESAMAGDGSGMAFYQSDEDDLLWFQTLLAMIGKRGGINQGKQCVAIANQGRTEMQSRHFKAASDEHYDGMVWCVGVPTGAFVVRRNGKVFITGNSGFPKSMDVAKAIDKRRMSDVDAMRAWVKGLGSREVIAAAAGVTPRQVDHWIGENTPCPQMIPQARFEAMCHAFGEVPEWADDVFERVGELRGEITHGRSGGDDFAKVPGSKATPRTVEDRATATPEAEQWQGWGTALKPAWEPIIMARKPLAKGHTVAANVLEHGTGALNIDATRIGYEPADMTARQSRTGAHAGQAYGANNGVRLSGGELAPVNPSGRWPANVLLTHHQDCVEVGTKRVRTSSHPIGSQQGRKSAPTGTVYGFGEERRNGRQQVGEDGKETVEAWECVEDCPVRLLDEQTGTLTTGGGKRNSSKQTGILGEFSGKEPDREFASDSGGASRFFYSSKVAKKERNAGLPEGMVNTHPTVKPISVMQWLVKLVTPPGGTVLDPFMGSGSTGVAAAREGMSFVGADLDPDYVDLASHRCRHAGAEVEIMVVPTPMEPIEVASEEAVVVPPPPVDPEPVVEPPAVHEQAKMAPQPQVSEPEPPPPFQLLNFD